MCNAWNHHPNCTCGWGGVGHLGRRESSNHNNAPRYGWVPPITSTYESYVNPNALCPVCGAAVFFYQSPNGGRVFFDELGPPWPKHPCTDSSSIPKKLGTSGILDTKSGADRQYRWQTEGWYPFFFTLITEIDKHFIKIQGVLNGKNILLYARKMLLTPITKQDIAHARKVNEYEYLLSVITTLGKNVTIKCYPSLSSAREKNPINTKPMKRRPRRKTKKNLAKNKASVSDKKNAKGQKKHRNIAKVKKSDQKKDKGLKKHRNTAIALAFTEAKDKQDKK